MATLTIATSANPGVTSFRVNDNDGKKIGRVEFTITDAVPGPIPPGIDPQVDVFWKVMAPKATEDNFGRFVRKRYYAVEVVIGNSSGFDLQLASVGFLLRDLDGTPNNDLTDNGNQFLRSPTDDYHVVRSTIEKSQIAGPRAYVLNSLTATSLLGTGVSPFLNEGL